MAVDRTQRVRVASERAWVWVRWAIPLLLTLVLIPLYRSYRALDERLVNLEQHRKLRVEPFMAAGPRFSGTEELPNAEALLQAVRLETLQAIAAHRDAGAHPGVDQILEVLREDNRRIENKVDELLRRGAR